LAELNEAVRECVTEINAKVMKQLKQSRNELFATLDRPASSSTAFGVASSAEARDGSFLPP
jgi:hypothetical protein